MATITNPASNLSYTSKDFQTIFPELLELTKELSPRWNPAELSTEPDPGVALLKINAILGDKLNYAIDKNILEAFPMSLTQQSSAQKIYSLLGYNMHWYESAWTDVIIKWIGQNTSDQELTIPTFTMVTDDDGENTFTLIGSNEDLVDGQVKATPILLPRYNSNSNSCTVRALQGTAITFKINGEQNIRINNLDANNRIYFEDADVASNGIFIRNVGSSVYDWTKVDNLLVQSLGNKYFEFGITDDLYSCYIEFPEDAEDMIRDGIQIVYIKSSGEEGNIPSGTLTKFISDLYVADYTLEDASDIALNSTNTYITNLIAATDGKNPETIDESYKNYKRIVGTFDTLVTLRDYTNAFLSSNLVSNGFVCDKTNDVQCSYTIKAIINGVDTDMVQQEQMESSDKHYIAADGKGYYNSADQKFYKDELHKTLLEVKNGYFYQDIPTNNLYYYTGSSYTQIKNNQHAIYGDAMNAISIKLYLLQKPTSSGTLVDVHKSFNLIPNQNLSVIKENLSAVKDYKHIGTEYSNMLPKTYEHSRPCMFVNKYIIEGRIFPKQVLSKTEIDDILKNTVPTALYKGLSSDNLNFGDAIQVDYVTQLIQDADERIKTVYVDNISYTTFADQYNILTYDDQGNDIGYFTQVCISEDDDISYESTYCAEPIGEDPYTEGDLVMKGNRRYRCLRTGVTKNFLTAWTLDEYEFSIDYQKFVKNLVTQPVGGICYGETIYIQTGPKPGGDPGYTWYLKGDTTTVDLSLYGITHKSGTLDYKGVGEGKQDIVGFRISDATQIRDEVFAKSILAGTTPLIEHAENEMDQSFLSPYRSTYADVSEIQGKVKAKFLKSENYVHQITPNEILEFYSPTFTNVCTYDNYVKIEGHLDSDIVAGADRQLNTGEYLIFYSLPDSTDTDIYTYHAYGQGAIVHSSYAISKSISNAIAFDKNNGFLSDPGSIKTPGVGWRVVQIGSHQFLEATPDIGKLINPIASSNIDSYNDAKFILTGTKSIIIKTVDAKTIDNNYSCYWILSEKTITNRYVLMEKDKKYKVLGNDEYFMYTNESMSTFEVYGQGTKITRTNADEPLEVTADISYETLLSSGLSTLSGKLYIPSNENPLTVIKNQSVYLSNGTQVLLSPIDADTSPTSVTIADDGVYADLFINTKGDGSPTYVGPGASDKYEVGWDYSTTLTSLVNSEPETTEATINLNFKVLNTTFNDKVDLKKQTGIPAVWESEEIAIGGNTYKIKVYDQYVGVNNGGIRVISTDHSLDISSSTMEACVFTPTSGNALKQFVIKYKSKTENDWTNTLSIINLNNLVGWDALTILSLNFDSSSGQILYPDQEVVIYGDSWTKKNDIGTSIYGSGYLVEKVEALNTSFEGMSFISKAYEYYQYPVKLFSDNPIDITSTAKTEIMYKKDEDDEQYTYSNISLARHRKSSSPVAVSILTTGGIVLTIPTPEKQGTTEIKYNSVITPIELKTGDDNTDGNYIARLTSSSAEVTSLKMYFMRNKCFTAIITGSAPPTVVSGVEATPKLIILTIKDDAVYRSDSKENPITYTYDSTTLEINYPEFVGKEATIEVYMDTLVPLDADEQASKPGSLENSMITTLYGDNNLYNCESTPVTFTIPHKFDPAIYTLPLYLVARIELDKSKLSDVETITITNPVRYQYNSSVSRETMEKYKALVKKYDTKKIFNYTYEIPEAELIKNPLDPKSFLNSNHIYNKNTICEYVGYPDLGVIEIKNNN